MAARTRVLSGMDGGASSSSSMIDQVKIRRTFVQLRAATWGFVIAKPPRFVIAEPAEVRHREARLGLKRSTTP